MPDMTQLDILLPFSLPPEEMAQDLLRSAKAPGLAWLCGKARDIVRVHHDPYARALPHEAWLSTQAGFSPQQNGCPPVAAATLRHFTDAHTQGYWFILHPAHVHLGMNHLAMTDIAALDLNDTASRQLFDSALPLFTEDGLTLVYGDAQTWFVRADDWHTLDTASPGIANGRNMDLWLPQGHDERAWRRLHNELQMLWYNHPVNDERENRGSKPVNGLWLWGGAPQTSVAPSQPPTQFINPPSWLQHVLPSGNALSAQQFSTLPVSTHTHVILTDERLSQPALATEWGMWLENYSMIDTDWLIPAIAALKDKQVKLIRLILTGEDKLYTFTIDRQAIWSFWRKPNLSMWLP